MTLFIENLISKTSPSTIEIAYPAPDSIGQGTIINHWIRGLLVSEPSLSTSVRWGPILNDVTNLQDVASLLGQQSMWTWIGASTMCWKGTDPLKTSFDFYLINYRPGLGIEDSLKELNYLTALVKDGNASVHIHGGYAANVLATNSSIFNNRVSSAAELATNADVGSIGIRMGSPEGVLGTLSITIGNKIYLNKMLISRLDITPSLIEVSDKKALYYRVSMSLVGTQPLLSTDVANMYLRRS